MQARFIGILLVTGTLFAAPPARAQDVMAGRTIARTWCIGCHNVDARNEKTGNDAVPSFASIANMSSTTEMSLAVFLSTSHGRMPDYSLSRIEIQNVSAYIVSLKKSR